MTLYPRHSEIETISTIQCTTIAFEQVMIKRSPTR